MLALYQKRLQILPALMSSLHQIVKNDEVCQNLHDPSLQKYRIDRINELVSELMNSEKEKMLIRVLEKYQQLQTQIKESEKQKARQHLNDKNNNESKLIDKEQKLKLQAEITRLSKTITEKDSAINKSSKELQQLRLQIMSNRTQHQQNLNKHSKTMSVCSKCELLAKNRDDLKQELQLSTALIQKLKKDGQSAIQSLNQKVSHLTAQNERLSSELSKKQQSKLSLVKQNKQETSATAKRNQKVEVMRRQAMFLEDELLQVQRQFNVIKQVAVGNVLNELKKLKNIHNKNKEAVRESLKNFQEYYKQMMQNLVQKIAKVYSKNNQIKPDRLMLKINQIDNQLDYFLQNQILAE